MIAAGGGAAIVRIPHWVLSKSSARQSAEGEAARISGMLGCLAAGVPADADKKVSVPSIKNLKSKRMSPVLH